MRSSELFELRLERKAGSRASKNECPSAPSIFFVAFKANFPVQVLDNEVLDNEMGLPTTEIPLAVRRASGRLAHTASGRLAHTASVEDSSK